MRCHPEMFQNTKMPSIFSCEVYLLPPHDGFKRDQPRPKSSAFIALYIGCIFSFSGFYSFRLVNLLSKRFRYTYIWICIYIYIITVYIYIQVSYIQRHMSLWIRTYSYIHYIDLYMKSFKVRLCHQNIRASELFPLPAETFAKLGNGFFTWATRQHRAHPLSADLENWPETETSRSMEIAGIDSSLWFPA